jgi:hypothetical protein
MTEDPYTMDMRLCDDAGMVSNELIDDGKPSCDKTYLDRLNRLRNISLRYRGDEPEFITEPFTCTGDAHLAYEHIRCTSVAHRRGPSIASLNPCAQCGWSVQFCKCNGLMTTVLCACGNANVVMWIAHRDDCPVKRVLQIVEKSNAS